MVSHAVAEIVRFDSYNVFGEVPAACGFDVQNLEEVRCGSQLSLNVAWEIRRSVLSENRASALYLQ